MKRRKKQTLNPVARRLKHIRQDRIEKVDPTEESSHFVRVKPMPEEKS